MSTIPVSHIDRLNAYQICTYLTVDEFIGLCNQVEGNFEIVSVERDENLDPVAYIDLPSGESKVIKVIPWPIS